VSDAISVSRRFVTIGGSLVSCMGRCCLDFDIGVYAESNRTVWECPDVDFDKGEVGSPRTPKTGMNCWASCPSVSDGVGFTAGSLGGVAESVPR